jgi:hypothetical protein
MLRYSSFFPLFFFCCYFQAGVEYNSKVCKWIDRKGDQMCSKKAWFKQIIPSPMIPARRVSLMQDILLNWIVEGKEKLTLTSSASIAAWSVQNSSATLLY